MGDIILISLATVLNFALLRWKLKHERYADTITDLFFLVVLNFLFAGTYTGMAIAMTAGAFISLYLLAFPPEIKFDTIAMKKSLIIIAIAMVISSVAYVLYTKVVI